MRSRLVAQADSLCHQQAVVLCCFCLAFLLTCATLRAEGQGRAADDVQDMVFLGDGRPVLIRLKIHIDGKPYRLAWRDFVQAVVKEFDANGDGVLTKEEIERMPAAQMIFSGGIDGNTMRGDFVAPTLFQLDSDADGKITVEELATYMRRNGGPPLQVQSLSAPSPARPGAISPGQPRSATAEAFDETLFGLLDADKDGKLSRDELAAAPRVLLQRDENDDEVVTVEELLPGANAVNPMIVADESMNATPRADDGPIVLINPNESGIAPGRRIQMRYGREENQEENRPDTRKLTPKDIGLDEANFKNLDSDGDGQLNLTELSLFPLRAPDLELLVRVGKRQPGEAAVEILQPGDRPSTIAARAKVTQAGLMLDLGVTRFELHPIESPSSAGAAAANREQYKAQFRALDRDGNGYLDTNEVQRIPFLRSAFKIMDEDGDGQLFENEIVAYLDGIEGLRAKAQSGSVMLTIAEQGRGMFDLLDADRDGRLSFREMRGAVKLLDSSDHNGDGHFSRDEVPRNYPLTLGPAAGDPNRGRSIVRQPLAAPQPLPERSAGPLWFRKMDRNRDGDLSRREFLGDDEQFARLDADGDGLISQPEAEKGDGRERKR